MRVVEKVLKGRGDSCGGHEFRAEAQCLGLDRINHGEGSDLYNDMTDAKAQAKELRVRSKECAAAVNECKESIDRLQGDIEARKANRIALLSKSGLKAADLEDIVDEEEFRLMKDLREAKRSYKNSYEQMQRFKQAAADCANKTEALREALAEAFASRTDDNNFGGDDAGGADDQLDDQEAFDRLETDRVLAEVAEEACAAAGKR